MGHRASDCKKPHKVPKKNKIVYKGRVFALIEEEAQGTPIAVIGTLLINGSYAKVLFDSGTTHSFIFHVFAKSLRSHCMKSFDVEFLGKNPYSANARMTNGTPSTKAYLARNIYLLKFIS